MGAAPTEHERRRPLVRAGRGHQRCWQVHVRAEPCDPARADRGSRPEIEVINPDLITGEILRSEPLLPLEEANIRAADECTRRVRDLVKRADRSFVIETVLSTDKYKPIVRVALKKGFQVLFVYVVLGSVEEAIARVAARVARGGHDVPVGKIRKRWPRSLENLPWFWQHATRALVYFNGSSAGEPVLMAERRGSEVRFALDAPAPWALDSLLPTWRPRHRKR